MMIPSPRHQALHVGALGFFLLVALIHQEHFLSRWPPGPGLARIIITTPSNNLTTTTMTDDHHLLSSPHYHHDVKEMIDLRPTTELLRPDYEEDLPNKEFDAEKTTPPQDQILSENDGDLHGRQPPQQEDDQVHHPLAVQIVRGVAPRDKRTIDSKADIEGSDREDVDSGTEKGKWENNTGSGAQKVSIEEKDDAESKEKDADPDDQDQHNNIVSSWLIPATPDATAADRLREHMRSHLSPLVEQCPPTVQVRVEAISDGNDTSSSTRKWRMQAMDEWGHDKLMGGDEFYVTYTVMSPGQEKVNPKKPPPPAHLVALIQDFGNGTYGLEFVVPPMMMMITPPLGGGQPVTGMLTVHFQYTCGIGVMPMNLKKDWLSGGSTHISHSMYGIRVPPFRKFVPPNRPAVNARGDDDDDQNHLIDLASFDLVIGFGDSLIRQMFKRITPVPALNNIHFRIKLKSHLSLDRVGLLLEQLNATQYRGLKPPRISHTNSTGPKVGLVLGSSVWDIAEGGPTQGSEFADHLQACRKLVTEAQRRYPHVQVFWKSPSAVHIHRSWAAGADCDQVPSCINSTRYVSTGRMYYLYQQQKLVMQELQVPWLDVYEAFYLSADRTLMGDVRHYDDDFSALALSYFYPHFDYLQYRLAREQGANTKKRITMRS